jgi:hypothetical protein
MVMLGHAPPLIRQGPVLALLALGGLFASCSFPDYRAPLGPCDAGRCTPGDAGKNGVGGSVSSGGTPSAAGTTSGTSGAVASAGSTSEGGAGAASDESFGGDGLAGSPGVVPEPGELDGVYRLVVKHSSKCLDPNGKTTLASNVTLQQLGCDDSSAQDFTLTHADGGYSLRIDASSDCVDTEGSDDDGTPIIRSPCRASASQRWQPLRLSDGAYLMVNASSSKCLDIHAASLDEGQSVQEWVCNGNSNQRWFFNARKPTSLPLVVDEAYTVDTWSSSGAAAFSLTPPAVPKAADDTSCSAGGARAPGARGNCHVVSLATFPSSADHIGASWVHPSTTWGAAPGLLIAPGAVHVHFQARGAKGGEGVTFQVGGIGGHTFNDSLATSPLFIVLTTSWQSYNIDLTSEDYQAGVITGFLFSAKLASNKAPLTFYVDDLVWE